MPNKKVILCIPGLGGYEKVFSPYEQFLPDYKLIHVGLTNINKAETDMEQVIKENGSVIVLANCYGVQSILRLYERLPAGSIEKLIVIEPFFAEFYWWRQLAYVVNGGILKLLTLARKLGLYRRSFDLSLKYPDLPKRYPLAIQPLFDISNQSLIDYFTKIEDILSFKLPRSISIPTFFILSPGGYMKDREKRKALLKHFEQVEVTETGKRTHDIVAASVPKVAKAVAGWLSS